MRRPEIRLLKTHEEYRACERLQKIVWGNLGVGSEVLSVTQKYGGVVLGTMVGGKVVGFLYAFLARYHGQLIHWSHMMAVEEGYRDQGLGFRMKLAHRKLALRQGISSICWTYDPLQSRNAALNLHRLGARVEEYIPDCYGQFPSLIERGLPSDRFVVNWLIGSAHVERRLKGEQAQPDLSLPRINETWGNARGYVKNHRFHLGLRDPRLLVEIPANTDKMRVRKWPLASRWRMETREVFNHYFQAGYEAVDFFPPSPTTRSRCYYLLARK